MSLELSQLAEQCTANSKNTSLSVTIAVDVTMQFGFRRCRYKYIVIGICFHCEVDSGEIRWFERC